MRILYYLFIASGILLVNLNIQAQPKWLWAEKGGGSSQDIFQDVVTDAQGNSYYTGNFSGTATIGGISHTASAVDIFVTKYNKAGSPVWSIKAGGSSNDHGKTLALDNSGNVYVVGYYNSPSITYGNTVNRAGDFDIFVMKVNANGTAGWIKSFGSTGNDAGMGIRVDQTTEDIYITGHYTGAVVMGSAPALPAVGNVDIFIAKLDNTGAIIWAKGGGSTGADSPSDLRVDNGYVYVTGYTAGNINFGGLTGTGLGGQDICMLKYSTSGTPTWVKLVGGTGNDLGISLVITPSGKINCTGRFSSTVNFGSTAGSKTSAGDIDVFVAQYTTAGVDVWVNAFGSTATDHGRDIEVDVNENVYVTGAFSGTVTITGLNPLASSGGTDIFFVRYSSGGTPQLAIKGGSTSNDQGSGIAVGSDNRIFLSGTFQGSATFGSINRSSSGSDDGFMASLNVGYTWTGTSSTAWNNNTNWSPNGIPGGADDVTIVSATNQPLVHATSSVNEITMTSGTLDLNTYSLTSQGVSLFNGGNINNGTMSSQGSSATYAGTTFGATVSATCGDVLLNGSVFNNPVSITKNGLSTNVSTGGNTFNSTCSITVTSGSMTLANTNPDIFNSHAEFSKPSGTSFIVANNETNIFKGNLTANAGITFGAGNGVVEFSGDNTQEIPNSSTAVTIPRLTINKTGEDVTFSKQVIIGEVLTFSGSNTAKIINNANMVFVNGSEVSGNNLTNYIKGSGTVTKIGNEAFLFPIGGTAYRSISISAPSSPSAEITAKYFEVGQSQGSILAADLKDISDCEYWSLVGTHSVEVTLHWNPNTCSPINHSVMAVAKFNSGASEWENKGAVVSGNSETGTVTSSGAIDPSGYFTLGYTSMATINTVNVNETDFTISGADNFHDNGEFVSGASGTNNGVVKFHPSPSSTVTVNILAGDNEQMDVTLGINSNGEFNSVQAEFENSLHPLSSDFYSLEDNNTTVKFYKDEKPLASPTGITTNLGNDGLTIDKQVNPIFTITIPSPGFDSHALKVYYRYNSTVYYQVAPTTNSTLTWDASSAANGVYRYELELTSGSTTKTYKGQLIVK